ncbi:MAG: DUF6544 family protein [Candidatus Eisenbacteria bacterium]
MIFRILLVLLLATALAALLAVFIGNRRWHRDSGDLGSQVANFRPVPSASRFDARELTGLPAPVVRYFTHVLTPGQHLVTRASFIQDGTFLMKLGADGWRSFQARQEFGVSPPAFIWDARISMGPGMPVYVRDSYVAGRGAMRAELLALFPVAEAHGTREMAQGSLQRYLAEAMWLPTSLLPSQGVRWSARDDSSAIATLTDGATTVSLEFHFNAAGDVRRVYTPARLREMDGRFVPMPWGAECSRHEEHEGMRIPSEAEVSWWVEGQRMPYWRGRITQAKYTFAP